MSAHRRYLPAIISLMIVATSALCHAQSDTIRFMDTASTGRTDTGYVMTKNPTTAILFSIVPGGGQVYTEQYLKAAVFAGVAGFFVARTIYYHSLFIDRANRIDVLPAGSPDRDGLKIQREFYRDQRDLHAAYYLGTTILSMIDAYVGAHMFDFDVDEEVSSRIYFTPMQPGVGFAVRW